MDPARPLSAGEAQQRRVLDALPAAVALVLGGRITWCNRAACDLLRRPVPSGDGQDASAWFVDPRALDALGSAAAKTEPGGIAVQMRRGDGSVTPARVVQRPVDPDDPGAGSVLLVEPADNGREAELHSILASTMDGVLAVGEGGRVIHANKRFYEMWRLPEAVTDTMDDGKMLDAAMAHLKDPDAFARRVRELNASTEIARDELELKDGRVFERTTAPLIVDGRVTGRIWSFRDVTLRVRAEAALRTSESNLAATLGAISDLIFILDRNGCFLQAHCPPGVPLYTPEDRFIGKHYSEVLPESVSSQITEAFRAVEETGTRRSFDYSMLLEGRETWWTATLSRRLDFAGRSLGVVAVARDMTARRTAERDLLESRENYLGLFNAVSEAIYVHDTDGTFIEVNGGAERMYGYTRAEMKGMTAVSVGAPGRNDIAAVMRLLQDVAETGVPASFEFWGRRKNGEVFPKACVMHRGKYFGRTVLITTARDISDAKARDEQIREQAALLDVTQDAILVLGLDRRVTLFNRGAEVLYGVRKDAALGRSYESIVYGEPPPGFEAEWQALIAGGELARERRQNARMRGEITVQERATLLRDESGRPRAVLVVVTDTTEARRLESQFLRAQRLESLGSLASGIAHDLNNVLTPILISSGILAESKLPPQEAEMVQLLAENARRGADIVRQLLLYSRGSDSPRASMSVRHVLRDMEQIMRETFPRSITLSFSTPLDLWRVEGDRTQIHQVLLNLCVNSRDAMPEGGTLSVRVENVVLDADFAGRHPGAQEGPHIVIRVKDNGCGIPAEHLEKIFDPFFTTKPFGQGTGLGLASVLGIVRGHGGFLTVESTVGAGSEFSVFLPAHESTEGGSQAEQDRSELQGHGEMILVVDDEASVRDVVASVFGRFGYQVATANDGAMALEVFARQADNIQLVITDLMMPVKDGWHFARALREIRPSMPLIAISGVQGHRTEFEARFPSMARFMPKPFAFDALLAEARALLRGRTRS